MVRAREGFARAPCVHPFFNVAQGHSRGGGQWPWPANGPRVRPLLGETSLGTVESCCGPGTLLPAGETRHSMPSAPPVKRVLVVDDHAATRAVVQAVLTAERAVTFQVVEAASGSECLHALEDEGPFDLILLDIGLPDMDGYEVCRAIRRVDAKIPIVFVTGQRDLSDFSAGRQAGGDSYLVKPVNRASLRSIALLFTSLERSRPAPAPEAQTVKT